MPAAWSAILPFADAGRAFASLKTRAHYPEARSRPWGRRQRRRPRCAPARSPQPGPALPADGAGTQPSPCGRAHRLLRPRRLLGEVRCPDGGASLGRINSAYAFCGPEGTLETIRNVTGLPVHYIITVNFDGFRQTVDKLGGVWLDVDRKYFNDNQCGGYSYATISLRPGYQRLTGSQALDFVRFR